MTRFTTRLQVASLLSLPLEIPMLMHVPFLQQEFGQRLQSMHPTEQIEVHISQTGVLVPTFLHRVQTLHLQISVAILAQLY